MHSSFLPPLCISPIIFFLFLSFCILHFLSLLSLLHFLFLIISYCICHPHYFSCTVMFTSSLSHFLSLLLSSNSFLSSSASKIFMADLLIPMPECRSITLHPGHEFLIIASDGLWDVISSKEAVNRARAAIALGHTASEAAEELCDLAIKLGSSDNVTTIIVQFTHN